MVQHMEVAQAWACRDSLRGSRMFTDGKTVWSHGEHWPLATWIGPRTVLLNTESYGSSSTAKHLSYVNRYMGHNVEVIECDSNEIRKAVNRPSEPIIITKYKDLNSFDKILDSLRTYLKNKGMKKFPEKRVSKAIEDTVNKHIRTVTNLQYGLTFEHWFNEFEQRYDYRCYRGNKIYCRRFHHESNYGPFQAFMDEMVKKIQDEIARKV